MHDHRRGSQLHAFQTLQRLVILILEGPARSLFDVAFIIRPQIGDVSRRLHPLANLQQLGLRQMTGCATVGLARNGRGHHFLNGLISFPVRLQMPSGPLLEALSAPEFRRQRHFAESLPGIPLSCSSLQSRGGTSARHRGPNSLSTGPPSASDGSRTLQATLRAGISLILPIAGPAQDQSTVNASEEVLPPASAPSGRGSAAGRHGTAPTGKESGGATAGWEVGHGEYADCGGCGRWMRELPNCADATHAGRMPWHGRWGGGQSASWGGPAPGTSPRGSRQTQVRRGRGAAEEQAGTTSRALSAEREVDRGCLPPGRGTEPRVRLAGSGGSSRQHLEAVPEEDGELAAGLAPEGRRRLPLALHIAQGHADEFGRRLVGGEVPVRCRGALVAAVPTLPAGVRPEERPRWDTVMDVHHRWT